MEVTEEQVNGAIEWYQSNGIIAEKSNTNTFSVLVLVNGHWLEVSSQEIVFRALCNEE